MVVLVGFSFLVNVLIACHTGIPQPLVHDESSYLLAADTFAHGRLTNPAPPFPEHFETFQELMVPTYMSKYFPAQGLALALGQVLTGKAIVGVWICTAAAVGVVYWMLLGFVPNRWALPGGVVAAMHTQLLDWSQTYWGGSVPALGGALFIGAWGRCICSRDRRAVIWGTIGLLILVNSRPFEGLVLMLPLLVALVMHRRADLLPIAAAAAIPLALGLAAMGYFNHRVTGHAWRLPYLEYAAQYEIYPKLWILPAGPARAFPNAGMAYVHGVFERGAYFAFSNLQSSIDNSRYRFNLLFTADLNQAILLLPLLMALLAKKSLRLRWIVISIGIFIMVMWTELFLYSHYLAPMLPAVILLVIFGWMRLDEWRWRERAVGRSLAIACMIGFVTGAGMAAAQPDRREADMLDQQSVIAQLPQLREGRHLLLVSYAPMHSYHSELIHNLSDINSSRVIWARSFGVDGDRAIAEHFKDRQVWELNVGGKFELQPYPFRGADRN